MPVLSKGSESAERRREAQAAFLLAAEALLADGHPYAELSVEQISAAAGRSRTAFYLYFRDKRELLMRLTEAVAATLYDEADRWWSGDDGRRDLRTALADVLGTYREHADLLRAVVEASAYDEEVAEFWRALGGSPPAWQDEKDAPPVDEEVLGRYVLRETTEDQTRRIGSLVVRFRSWAEALCQAYARARGGGRP